MMNRLEQRFGINRLRLWIAVVAVLGAAALFGAHASLLWLTLILLGLGAVVVVQRPVLGLLALVLVALVARAEFGTGTAVAVNPATLLVPTLLVVWVLYMVLRKDIRVVPSRTNAPLGLFLLSAILSLLLGTALWDPSVPRSGNLIVVQLAQWAIFAFSAGVFWLTGNLIRDEIWLQHLTFVLLALAGTLAILYVIPGTDALVGRVATFALNRAPFWMLLTAVAGGQLLFNHKLAPAWRLFLLASVGAAMLYAFRLERATASNWVGVGAVVGVLAWLRFPRLRWLVLVLMVVLTAAGLLQSSIYSFAGGGAEWNESGGSRLVLIGRVVEVAMRNPITGLGPAAYRSYARVEPLIYGGAFWVDPQVNSHNNYVDLFAHVGLLGLGIFAWFSVEVIRLGFRLRTHFSRGFSAGYVNSMLAAWIGALTLMLFADWILPHVYNIGFPGFQASVLVWLFLGGLVSLEQIAAHEVVE
jgi:hypothetical protein